MVGSSGSFRGPSITWCGQSDPSQRWGCSGAGTQGMAGRGSPDAERPGAAVPPRPHQSRVSSCQYDRVSSDAPDRAPQLPVSVGTGSQLSFPLLLGILGCRMRRAVSVGAAGFPLPPAPGRSCGC